MADKNLDSRDNKTPQPRQEDTIATALNNCGLLGGGNTPKAFAASPKAACNLPSVNIDNYKPSVDALATELRRTMLLGMMSWVYPDKVLGALRNAHPSNSEQFETAFSKFHGGNLRQELGEQLQSADYRTAISILENRQDQKLDADKFEEALKKAYGGGKSPDIIGLTLILAGMDAKKRAQFERDFPKNEGDNVTLRGEIKNYVEDANAYKRLVSMLDADDTSQPVDKTKPQQASIREWLDSFKKLNAGLNITGIPDIDLGKLNEKDFKADYAKEVLRIGKQHGFGAKQLKDIASGLYAIELGGWGTSFTTAKMPPDLLKPGREDDRLDFHPSSSGVGYNQMLKSTTIALVDKHRNEITSRLKDLSTALPATDPRAKELEAKAEMIGAIGRYLDRSELPPGVSKKEFEEGVQALNLDKDVGPLIQGQQLGKLLDWYQSRKQQHDNRNVRQMLTNAAERINTKTLAYDHLPVKKKVEAVNMLMGLSQPVPHDHATAASLSTKLSELKPGFAGQPPLSQPEQTLLTSAMHRAETLPPDHPVHTLVNKLTGIQLGKMTPEKLTPAAMEMANLAGQGGANGMLKHPYEPTKRYFSSEGMSLNRIAGNTAGIKTGEEFLIDLYKTIESKRLKPYPGNLDFQDAFERARRAGSI